MITKALIIYHANCMDGFAAYWAAHRGLKRNTIFKTITGHAAQYGEAPPYHLIDIDTAIWIVDFSYDWETLLKLSEHAGKVTVLDHHKTAIEALVPMQLAAPKNLHMTLDTTHSGAMLTWHHFNPASYSVPKIIQHVQDRDLWRFAMEGTKEFHMYLSTVDRTLEAWEDLHHMIDVTDECMVNYAMGLSVGGAILRYQQSVVESIAKKATTVRFADTWFMVVNCPGIFSSDVGNYLAKNYDKPALMWSDSNGTANISLRSMDHLEDISVIAKSFGGGGHRNAAGCEMPTESFLQELL